MATNFPTSLDSYSTKQNNVDTIAAAHVNDLQDAVVALETAVAIGAISRTAWTPTYSYASGSNTITYDTANTGGWYAQVAKVVFFTLRIAVTGISGAGSGNIVLSLPSTATTGNFSLSSVAVNTASGTWTVFPIVGRVISNSAGLNLFSYASGTGYTAVGSGNVGTPSVGTPLGLICSGFYFVT